MKLSLVHVKLFHGKKPIPILKQRRKIAKTKRKEVITKTSPKSCGSMDTTSNAGAETNDSASSMSFNEFETFADEVNGDIPEVDYRGRLKSEKLPSDVYVSSISLSQSQILKSDRTPNFIKVCSSLEPSLHNVSCISIKSEDIPKALSQNTMNAGKRRLRRRNTVFGRSKDDSFQVTSKPRRKGANSQNRWSLLSTRTPYEEFHRLFKSVPMDQFPINDFSCALSREILLQGRIYITQGWFCFYSNIFGWETQVTIDCTKIQSITKEKTAYVVPNAILVCTDEEKHFFSSFLSRETVYKLLLQVWDEVKAKNEKMDGVELENQKTEAGFPTEDKDVWEDEDEEQNAEENNDVDKDHECSAGEHGENAGHCEKCEQARKASSENLSRIKDVDEEGHSVISKRSGHVSHLGEKSSISRCVDSAKITGCAGAAMFLASIAETMYSYFQVSLRLVRRLTREQLFYITTCFLITCLLMCSLFLLQRISILEPKIMAQLSYPPEKILLQKSMYQLWKLRQEVFDAEVVRFKTIVAANLNAITQVRQTLKMLEDDLEAHMSRNCTLLENNVCVQI